MIAGLKSISHPNQLFSHCAVNCVQLYVHARMQGKWTRLVRPTIQFFLVAFAVYVGYTRVSDYKHHWSDVLIGLLQGALIAVLNVSFQDYYYDWAEIFAQKNTCLAFMS